MSAELYRIIQGAEGALADAGSVVVDPIEEGIRQLTRERDGLKLAFSALAKLVREEYPNGSLAESAYIWGNATPEEVSALRWFEP